jgi:hypothetical protein
MGAFQSRPTSSSAASASASSGSLTLQQLTYDPTRRSKEKLAQSVMLAMILVGAGLLQLHSRARRIRHERLKARRISNSSNRDGETTALSAADAEAQFASAHQFVSHRLQHALAHDDTPLQNLNHFIRMADPARYPEYHPRHQPDGYISAAIAENNTVSHLLPYLQHRPGLGLREAGYANFNGQVHVREVVADYLADYVYGTRTLNPEAILMTAGCNLAIDSLFFAIANPGEYVLLQTPYYAAFKCEEQQRACDLCMQLRLVASAICSSEFFCCSSLFSVRSRQGIWV